MSAQQEKPDPYGKNLGNMWYNDIEDILDVYRSGHITYHDAKKRLLRLGLKWKDVREEILGDPIS